MKPLKLSFDFSDVPELVKLLRLEAAQTRQSQKAILVQSLESYFAHRLENRLIEQAASKAFSEWDNEDDRVYDSL